MFISDPLALALHNMKEGFLKPGLILSVVVGAGFASVGLIQVCSFFCFFFC